MRVSKFAISLALFFGLIVQSASAVTVAFNYSGVDPSNGLTATGFFTIDNSLFDGTFIQAISNTSISSLSFNANTTIGLETFGTADINPFYELFFSSSVFPPTVFDGFAFLANNGTALLAVGASGEVDILSGLILFESYVGAWTYAGAVATPIPATLPLFATGLGVIGLLAWRRKRKNAAAIAA